MLRHVPVLGWDILIYFTFPEHPAHVSGSKGYWLEIYLVSWRVNGGPFILWISFLKNKIVVAASIPLKAGYYSFLGHNSVEDHIGRAKICGS